MLQAKIEDPQSGEERKSEETVTESLLYPGPLCKIALFLKQIKKTHLITTTAYISFCLLPLAFLLRVTVVQGLLTIHFKNKSLSGGKQQCVSRMRDGTKRKLLRFGDTNLN